MRATVPASQGPPTLPSRVAAVRPSFSRPFFSPPWAVRVAGSSRVGLRPWARPWGARDSGRPWAARVAAGRPSWPAWEYRVFLPARLGDPEAAGRAGGRWAGRAGVGPVRARPGGGSLAGARAASGPGAARAGG